MASRDDSGLRVRSDLPSVSLESAGGGPTRERSFPDTQELRGLPSFGQTLLPLLAAARAAHTQSSPVRIAKKASICSSVPTETRRPSFQLE